jgi:hypothetical protein
MLEKPALHTDFGGVGVCQGIWERGVFFAPAWEGYLDLPPWDRHRLHDLCWRQAIENLIKVEQLSPLRYRHVAVMPLKVLVEPIDGAAMLAAHKHPVQSKAGKYTLTTHRGSLQNRAAVGEGVA